MVWSCAEPFITLQWNNLDVEKCDKKLGVLQKNIF